MVSCRSASYKVSAERHVFFRPPRTIIGHAGWKSDGHGDLEVPTNQGIVLENVDIDFWGQF